MFKGSMPALITPFKNGKVDVDALKHLVDWHVAEGSHGLVPVGTTGESPTLSHSEHEEVIRVVVEHNAKRLPVIAGAGSNNTIEALRLMQFAKDVGADAALVVTPYYNKPTQRGLYEHFKALNDICLPIFVYNIPGRSVVDMSPKTMGELAKLEFIVGVKDATASMERVTQQRLECGEDFIQMSAEDASALGFFAHGGVGAISVTANVAPRLCASFQNSLANGDFKTALSLQDKLMPLHEAIFTEPGLVGAKYAASLLGKCNEEVRLPLSGLLNETKEKIQKAMRHAGILD
ncbi:4-hydroxy-tetrahydrodipicolinate synthase [Amylibacter sp.]|jgi:4-hydroxy-tetrahydrodipicolinate synthase|uniref:4-hydroxy-tetrahydrodipicolinate synthase n=2 Tax=environmental samples TaxID=47925 RepID=E0Y1A9_9PROT|nr:dihydrodipicolinate synthase/n-acetylneuraminate lyase [uncultured alpha proteobacterium EB080_L27A02]ADI20450.1 dihydrodipicolinate synthase/n-acetylneuraminate lyase [uncultured alpha proteobacterium EB080_L43F08]EAU52188.1 dihydrodipicolinate synthase [alpha proteobacterium HTCC2255] [Rhodobacterales bacterium HTCC2255]MBT4133858.1 4-hydroxy-tetrahydrodipicolinate synthase [Rhodobacterales bacterium]MCO4796503.1 4-hydroxy-tetrahydrodipicolinate synthase [Amylibacter sp.]MDC3289843.1 4-hy|tara:strand:+ start:304 stop:1176 length:873 start_codon:yes stop_codon:yes gene_type:complete